MTDEVTSISRVIFTIFSYHFIVEHVYQKHLFRGILVCMEPAAQSIKRISYIASLITNPSEVDTELDSLRSVTARIDDTSRPLASKDKIELLRVQKKLETYLVTQESLRQFTAESLRLQVEQHMSGAISPKSRTALFTVVTVATILAFSAVALPLPSVADHVMASGALEFSILTIGAAWLFWKALPAFTSKLRRAFLLICAGVTLLGISMLEQPIIILMNLRHYPIASIVFPLPILFGALFFHAGDLMYVRLLGIRNRWTSILPLIIGIVSMTCVTLLINYALGNESTLRTVVAIIWSWILVTPVVSILVLPAAIKKVPELYKPPIRFLLQSLFPIVIVVLYQYVIWLIGDPFGAGLVMDGLFGLVVIMALGLLRAGYEFNKVSQY